MKKIFLLSFILFTRLTIAIDQEFLKAAENLDVAKTKALYDQIRKNNYRPLEEDEATQVSNLLEKIVKKEGLFINPYDYSYLKKYRYYKNSNYLKIGLSIISLFLSGKSIIISYNTLSDIRKDFPKSNKFIDFEFHSADLENFIKNGNFIYDTKNTDHDAGIIIPFMTLSGIAIPLSIWQITKNIQNLKRKEKAAQICDILKSTLRIEWR